MDEFNKLQNIKDTLDEVPYIKKIEKISVLIAWLYVIPKPALNLLMKKLNVMESLNMN